MTVTYEGDLAAQELDENWIGRQRLYFESDEALFGLGEPRYVYSNRSYWYPQGAGQRLRYGDARSVGSGRVGGRRERGAGPHEPAGGRGLRRGRGPAPILVRGAAAGPLSVGGDLPVRGPPLAGPAGPARRPRVHAVNAGRRRRLLRHPRDKRLRLAAKRGRDRRHGRDRGGHRLVLRVDSRRHPVSVDDRGPHRQPPSRRAQPRVLRPAQHELPGCGGSTSVGRPIR